MSKHSPGPWSFGRDIVDEEGGPTAMFVNDVTERDVCQVKSLDEEADARLIAAAPEMLELLRQFHDSDGDRPDLLYDISQLIARIEGKGT